MIEPSKSDASPSEKPVLTSPQAQDGVAAAGGGEPPIGMDDARAQGLAGYGTCSRILPARERRRHGLARPGIPQPGRKIIGGSQNRARIRAEPGRADDGGVIQRGAESSFGQLPDGGVAIGRTEGQPTAIPAEIATRDEAIVNWSPGRFPQLAAQLAGFRVPESRIRPKWEHHNRPAIRAEMRPVNGALRRQRPHELASLTMV